MAIEDIQIRSLGEWIDLLTPEAPDPRTGRRRDAGVYRGASNTSWPLLTSLDRLGGTNPPHTKADLEEHLLRNFIRYSRPFLSPAPQSEWELLFLAQHHVLPTRLLDWSYSPLIAAHFATLGGEPDADRVIWRLDWQALHRKFNLPELALLVEDLEHLFGNDTSFTPWRLMRGDPSLPSFACMLEPPSLDARLGAQLAVFTFCSNRQTSFTDFLIEHELTGALRRYVIPAAEVQRIRDQLDLAGIDERMIFPDLDGVAARMRRYYS